VVKQMDEGITEVQVVVKRIILNGEDPRRFMELLSCIKAGYPMRGDQQHWAAAMIEEIRREAF